VRGALTLKASYYEALKRLTLELAGVNLGANHAFLVETRLARLAREEGYASLEAMIDELFNTGKTRLAVQIVSALTERDTHFFKDQQAFDRLREHVLPDLYHKRGGGRLRLLSFGCASGQEAYGMAMTVAKMGNELDGAKIDILGVDYPSQALEDFVEFFEPDGENWIVKDEIQNMVKFRDVHLLSKLEKLDDFHAVMFCGSLPHYSAPARIRVLRGLSGLVKAHGYLILGTGENLAQMNFGFDRVLEEPGLYKKREVVLEEEEIDDSEPFIPIEYKAELFN